MSRFSPDIWSSLPPAELIRKRGYFREFINSESEDVGNLSEIRALVELDGYVDTTFEKPKRSLALAVILTNGTKELKDRLEKNEENDFHILELATSVFSCSVCETEVKGPSEASALVGWNELKNHLYCSSSKDKSSPSTSSSASGSKEKNETPLRADKGGAQDVISLLRLLTLSPLTTTAADLDRIDPRFLCMCCTPETHKNVTGAKAMGWRESVGFCFSQIYFLTWNFSLLIYTT